MKKFFLIPLVALFTCVNVWANVATITFSDSRADVNCADADALISALAALPTDGTTATVTLEADINITGASYVWSDEAGDYVGDPKVLKIPFGAKAILNLNGHGISKTLVNGAMQGNANIDKLCLIYNAGWLNIKNEGNKILSMTVTDAPSGIPGFSMQYGDATTICNSGDLIIDGGIFIGPLGGQEVGKLPVIWCMTVDEVTPNVTINSGTILCNETATDQSKGPVYAYGPLGGAANWVIKGGIFSTSDRAGDMYYALGMMTEAMACMTTTNGDHFETGAKFAENNLIDDAYTWINVPYSNDNIPGYNEADRSGRVGTERGKYMELIKRVCAIVPKTDRLVVNDGNTTDDEYTLASDDPFKFVYIEPGKTLSVPEGKTLRVNSTSGIILGGTDAKLVVEAGGAVISDGDIITSSNDNIELTMDAAYKEKGKVVGKYAHLLIKAGNIQAKHPNATVKLVSVCKNLNTWQRFAIPTYATNYTLGDIECPDKEDVGGGTAFFKWQYDGEDGNWVQLTSYAAVLEPFHGYIMTNNASEDGKIYTFKGELVGNGNPRLSLQNGWNYFANSYTAPISVEAMLVGMKENLDGEAAVWVQRNGAKNTWSDIAYADIKEDGINEALLLLQPMNTFVFKASEGTFDLEYDDFVYTPVKSAKGFAPRKAPAAAQDEDYKKAVIVLTDEEEEEELLHLYEGNDFSDSFDNGYDVSKMMNEEIFNAYFVSPALGNLSRLASDNVDNSSITLDTKETTHFTLSFRNVSLEGYSLKDNVADSLITISTDATYEFEALANTKYEGRFTVVKTEDPTAVENVEDTKHITNGIYSVTGVYMGNNINLLPAGIYIINGKKVVK